LEKRRDLQLAESAGRHDDPQRIGGAALRAVRELLDEKDPKHVWGGLEKVLTPEGHYLWLCKHHAEEYAKQAESGSVCTVRGSAFRPPGPAIRPERSCAKS